MNAKDIETAGCKRSATEACIVTEKFRYKRPPLPSPLLQRRRGNSISSPVTKLRCHCTSGFFPRPLSGLRLSYLRLFFFSLALAPPAPPPDTCSVLDSGAE